jgi:4-amino-4-deoxy-L-arabinose transferase-like glycosyltransferase
MRLGRKAAFALLAGLFLLLITANGWFVDKHVGGNPGDEILHLTTALHHSHHGLSGLSRVPYPPFFYLVSVGVHHLLGVSKQASIAANWPFLIALLLGTYGICFATTRSRGAAILAAALAAIYPMTASLSRMAMLDFALAGMVALALLALIRSDRFSNPGWTLGFGAICGFGMLTRGSFVIFLAGPVLVEITRAVLYARENADSNVNRRRLKMFLLATALGLVIASFWYLPEFSSKLKYGAERVSRGGNYPEFSLFSLKGMLFYPYCTADLSLSIWLALFFIVALPLFTLTAAPHRWLLVAGLLVPYLVFSNFDWKLARYITPLLPLVAVVTIAGLFAIPKNALRNTALVLLMLTGAAQWLILTFGIASPAWVIREGKSSPFFFGLEFDRCVEDVHMGPPNEYPSALESLGQVLTQETRERGQITLVRLLNTLKPDGSPGPSIHQFQLPVEYFITREDLPITLLDCQFDGQSRFGCLQEAAIRSPKGVESAEFFLTTATEMDTAFEAEVPLSETWHGIQGGTTWRLFSRETSN